MKIFISHSSKDNTIVKKITEILDEYVIEYWVDHKELKNEGRRPWTEINDGLESSDHFLLVFSKDAKKSHDVKDEFMTTKNHEGGRKTIIILRLDNTVLWPLANDLKYHSNVSEENIEDVMNEILHNILSIDTDTIKQFDIFLDKNNKQIELGENNYYSYPYVLKHVDRKLYETIFDEWVDQYRHNNNDY